MIQKSKTAVFPGSFDPFTIGHDDILRRALELFDQVVVAVGFNIHKADAEADAARRADEIRRLYQNLRERVDVVTYSGLTVDLVKKLGACCIVRGLRNSADFEYEKNLAEVNMRIAGVETIFLPCRPELACVSSSTVRELDHFGYDTSPFLPGTAPRR